MTLLEVFSPEEATSPFEAPKREEVTNLEEEISPEEIPGLKNTISKFEINTVTSHQDCDRRHAGVSSPEEGIWRQEKNNDQLEKSKNWRRLEEES